MFGHRSIRILGKPEERRVPFPVKRLDQGVFLNALMFSFAHNVQQGDGSLVLIVQGNNQLGVYAGAVEQRQVGEKEAFLLLQALAEALHAVVFFNMREEVQQVLAEGLFFEDAVLLCAGLVPDNDSQAAIIGGDAIGGLLYFIGIEKRKLQVGKELENKGTTNRG